MELDLTVVIIEDDIDDSELLIESFKRHHTSLITAFSKPSLFFNYAEKNDCRKICLLVIDMNLPEESGVDVIRRIRSTPELMDIPILVFTTGGTPAETTYCQQHKIEMFKKPSNVAGWESFAFVMAARCDPHLARNVK